MLWVVLLILSLLLGILTILMVSKWTLILHLFPGHMEITVKALFFTKFFAIPNENDKNKTSDKKRKKQKNVSQKNTDTSINSGASSVKSNTEKTGDKESPNMGIVNKISTCKAKILAYKDIIFHALTSLKNRIEIQNTYFRFDFGTGDAASTGQAVGFIWGSIGTLYPILNRYFIMDFPTVNITPDFYQKRFDYELKSIIKAKPVHIIKTLFVLVFSYLNMKKIKEV